MDEKMLAYLAGFFDGEGTVTTGYHGGSKVPHVLLSICNTDKRPLEIYKELFGGFVYEHKPGKFGNMPYWRWNSSSRDTTLKCLLAMMPYLVIKRSRAEIGIELLNRPQYVNYVPVEEKTLRIELSNRIKVLNGTLGRGIKSVIKERALSHYSA